MDDEPVTPAGRFAYALSFLLHDEGGFTDDPDDPGGATNLGITQNDLSLVASKLHLPANVQSLTRNDAATYYKAIWWDRHNYNAINSLIIATKVFDIAVNMGAERAHTLLQKALHCVGYGLKLDGILGAKTIAATNECCLHGRQDDLLDELREESVHYYQLITEENPKLYKFLKGWLTRAQE